jgi:hypothetical protein
MRTTDAGKARGVEPIWPVGRLSRLTARTMALSLVIAACASSGPGPASPALPSPSPSSAGPSAPTSTAVATPSGQADPETLVYPIANDEAWILFDAAATDPGEPGPHDALYLVRPDGTGLVAAVTDGQNLRRACGGRDLGAISHLLENLTGLVEHADEVVSRFGFDDNDCGGASCSTASRTSPGRPRVHAR